MYVCIYNYIIIYIYISNDLTAYHLSRYFVGEATILLVDWFMIILNIKMGVVASVTASSLPGFMGVMAWIKILRLDIGDCNNLAIFSLGT
jgi:hypothetical protein